MRDVVERLLGEMYFGYRRMYAKPELEEVSDEEAEKIFREWEEDRARKLYENEPKMLEWYPKEDTSEDTSVKLLEWYPGWERVDETTPVMEDGGDEPIPIQMETVDDQTPMTEDQGEDDVDVHMETVDVDEEDFYY